MLIATHQKRCSFSRCNVDQLKTAVVQVIQAHQADEAADFLIHKVVKFANLIVVAANLIPEVTGNGLKLVNVEQIKRLPLMCFTYASAKKLKSFIDFVELRCQCEANDDDE